MTVFLRGIGTVVGLELRQRVRTRAWYILLGIYFLVVGFVTLLLAVALGAFGADDSGAGILSTIIYFVLLLGTLVTPALSGNAINGDRADGTLATTQITQIGTWQIVLGKFLAAWVGALAFLAVSLPFIAICTALGGVRLDTAIVSLLVLVFELGVVAAVGVGLSGLLARPLFSIVVTYLVVAALSIGTLIVFTLAGIATQSTVTSTSRDLDYSAIDPDTGEIDPDSCMPWQTSTYSVPRFDGYWWILAANPYALLADATPTHFDSNGNPDDLFGYVKTGLRQAQIPPDLEPTYDGCDTTSMPEDYPTPEETIASTVPGWFVGALLHLVLAAGLLTAGWSATRTPAKRLAAGSRVA
jgi:ABC-2 type transport system permease protein